MISQPDDVDEPAPLAPGTLVGRFSVARLVGAGGMGVVYEAADPELDRRVAVKLLRPGRLEHRDRMLREAQALAQLSHPNVVHVYEVGVHDGRLFIAMELVEGQTLDELSASGPRPWRELLGWFLQAGRGLDAAHRKGIIHRDFKPQNVMLDGDGRVRVADFGLARLAASASISSDALTPADSAERRAAALAATQTAGDETEDFFTATPPAGRPLAAPLTRAGALLGTPRYMAPEQHDGRPASELSDQYAFCLAFWEALHGVFPFPGETMGELARAKRERRMARPPAGPRPPRWLVRALERGLAPRPADRHASLAALLAVLERTPARRRRFALAGAALGLVGAAVAGTAALRRGVDPAARCEGAAGRVQAVWSAERAAAARAAMVATGVPWAAAAWITARRRLDEQAGAIAAMRVDACRATHQRGEQSAEALDLRMVCLDRLTDGLDAAAATLAGADAEHLDGAVRATLALPAASRCADLARLREPLPLPDGPAARAAIARARAALAHAGAQLTAGRPAGALALAEAQTGAVAALGFAPLTAEHQLLLGAARRALGRLDEAEPATRAAYVTAEQARDDDVRASAMLEQGELLVQAERYAEWDALVPMAEALLARVGDLDRQALFTMSRSLVASRRGKLTEAVALGEQALAMRERATPHSELHIASVLAHLGNRYAELGDLDRAEDHARRALEIFRRTWGDLHPNVAAALTAIGGALLQRKRLPESLAAFAEAHRIYLAVHGPDHRRTLGAANNVGLLQTELGRFDEGRLLLEDTLRRAQAVLGSKNETVGNTLDNLGHNAFYRKDHAAAIDYYRRTVAHFAGNHGPTHPNVARARVHLAAALLEKGDARAAAAEAEAALPVLLQTYGEGQEDVVAARDLIARSRR